MPTPLLPASKKSGQIVDKKISTSSLFGKNKKDSAIVKADKSSIQLRPKISSSIINYPLSQSEQEEKKSDDFIDIRKKFFSIGDSLDSIIQYFTKRNSDKVKESKEQFKKEDKEKKEKRESELEKPKSPIMKGVKAPSIPKFSFLDTIINFFSNILLGSLLNFLLSKKDFIFKAFDDILKGFDNIFNVLKFSIISISNTAGNLVKSVAQVATKLFKGPAKLTFNLLKKLGGTVKGLLFKAGKAIGNFIKGTFKNISGLATGAASGSTRATGVQKRLPSSKIKPGTKPPKPGAPSSTNTSILKRSERLFGEKGAKHLGKVSKIFKKIPFIGALIGIGIDLAMGERLDNAIAGAAGATLGAAIGGAIGTVALPIPGVGSFLGGLIGAAVGDWAGKEIYKNISGQVSQINPKPEDLGQPQQQDGSGVGLENGVPSGQVGNMGGSVGNVIATGAFATYYDPSLGGINASGAKTASGEPATATGEPYRANVFSAAAFPPLLKLLPSSYLANAPGFPGGKTLARPINLLVTDPSTGKKAIIRVNDVGPGVSGHRSNHMLDFSVAAKNYFGENRNNLSISIAPSNSSPGRLTNTSGGSIEAVAASQNQGITYQTNTYRNQYYGAPRPGRRHAGVDIQMYSGSKQITFLGGRVVHIGNDPGGYYTYVDILTPTGKIERLAELGRLDPAVKKGAVLAPGQVVSRGVGPTGVTHLEYRNPGTSGFSGTVNPLEYLKSIGSIFGGNTFQYKGGVGGVPPAPVLPSPASLAQQPTQSLSQQARQLVQQASYEGQQQIVPIPIPMGGDSSQPPVIMGSGGGSTILPVGISKKDSLNSYYQAQLIGFLYKQG